MGLLSSAWNVDREPARMMDAGWGEATGNNGGRLPQLSDAASPMARPLVDPLAAFPAASRERAVALRQRADDLLAAVDAAAAKREEARQALQHAEAAMRRLRGAHSTGGFQMPVDAEAVVQQQHTIDAARERMNRALAHCATVTENWRPLDIVVRAIDDFIARSAGAEIRPHAGPKPVLAKGETFGAAIARVREKITALRDEASRVQAAPVDRGEQVKLMEAEIDTLAERGRPSVIDGEIGWPMVNARVQVYLRAGTGIREDGFAGGDLIDTTGMFCWLHGPALKAALRTVIEGDAKAKNAMTAAQRETRLREIASEILDLDRREAALIEAGEAEGFVVAFRPDINPVAVLGVA